MFMIKNAIAFLTVIFMVSPAFGGEVSAHLFGIQSVVLNNDGTVTLIDKQDGDESFPFFFNPDAGKTGQSSFLNEVTLSEGETATLTDGDHFFTSFHFIGIKDGKMIIEQLDAHRPPMADEMEITGKTQHIIDPYE